MSQHTPPPAKFERLLGAFLVEDGPLAERLRTADPAFAEALRGALSSPVPPFVIPPATLDRLRELRDHERSFAAGALQLEWMWIRSTSLENAAAQLRAFRARRQAEFADADTPAEERALAEICMTFADEMDRVLVAWHELQQTMPPPDPQGMIPKPASSGARNSRVRP